MKHEYMKQAITVVPQEFDKATIGALADAFNKSFLTIERWIEANDDRLTSDKAKEVYARLQLAKA